jgi:hypothetical protein
MSGDEILHLRIDAALKKRVKEAAKRRGHSLTTFIRKAAEKAAKEVEKMDVTSLTGRVFQGVPSFFRALCFEATRGGESGYSGAGWALLHNLPTLVEGDTNEDIGAKLDELAIHLRDREDLAVIDWLKRELPRCMDLVPTRRRDQFLNGIYESWENEGEGF